MIPFETIPLLSGWKMAFREKATAQRKAAHQSQPLAGARAASIFMHEVDLPKHAKIALYHPFGSELDTWPLAERLAADGHAICLPVVVKKNAPLIFRLYEIDQKLVEGAYNIMAPPETAPEVIPDIIVTPLLGFKRDGARLGMGGGFYDRTLEKLRKAGNVTAIGYAYSGQEMKVFPVEKHDARMDFIVTDMALINPSQE